MVAFDAETRRQQVAYQKRQQNAIEHANAQIRRRAVRRSAAGRQDLDALNSSGEKEWRWEDMVSTDVIDASGYPTIKDAFAAEMDRTDAQRHTAHYWTAVHLLERDHPEQGAAYTALFHVLSGRAIDEDAEASTASRLDITLKLLRSRVWRAHQEMQAECGEHLPPWVLLYAEDRDVRIARQRRAARAAHAQRLKEGA